MLTTIEDHYIVTLTLDTGLQVELAPMSSLTLTTMLEGMAAKPEVYEWMVEDANVRLHTPEAVIDGTPESRNLYDGADYDAESDALSCSWIAADGTLL